MSRRSRELSDSQANAEALARRAAPYSGASAASFGRAWDAHRREPRDLREAVRMVRRAYADEVPEDLHEKGSDGIGDDGTPKWTARAAGYIFGNASADDAARDPASGRPDLVGYYFAPFRAQLDALSHGDEAARKRGAIVAHVTIGSQGPREAAIAEGVPAWCARVVAEDALRSFIRSLTDVRLHVGHHDPLQEASTAA